MSRPIEDGPAGPAVTLHIEKLIGGGRGLAHHDGATWMVMGALPGEQVVAQPTRHRAGIVEARALEVLDTPHPARPAQPCPHAETCGGCDWPHVDHAAGGGLKAAAAAEAAGRFPDLAGRIASAPLHTSGEGYRLRARLHWDPDLNRIGFYGHRSHSVAVIDSCRILSPRLMAALPVIAQALAASLPGSGRCGVARGHRTGGGGRRPPSGRGRCEEYQPLVGSDCGGSSLGGCGFSRSFASRGTAGGLGSGRGQVRAADTARGPNRGLLQGNRHLLGDLFERVAELIGEDPAPVFDLHAGVGFLAAAARSAAEHPLTLVEPNRVAARAAVRNLPDALVVAGRTAEDFLSASKNLPRNALVITDPPRRGMSRVLRDDLARWEPSRILTLGCDPATWARDAGHLMSHGYRVTELELFDLFPLTHHVEILALLDRHDR